MKVAIQGFAGSYHEIAANQYFGAEIELVMCDSFINLFKKLDTKQADCAVMAIENTIAGTILFNYSLLRNSVYKITGETFLRIEHCLMGLDNQSIDDITEVHSHPMALNQCTRFFAGYPNIKLVEAVDTGLMAEQIANEKIKGRAAIAGVGAASKFGLHIFKKNIEDSERNFTRFLVLENNADSKSTIENFKFNKATISFGLTHEVGGLSKILNILATEKINVMSLQSTPYVGNAWEYLFHLDIEFSDYLAYQKAIETIKKQTLHFSIMGEYKKGI